MASDRDPIAWLREVVESATPGPWRACPTTPPHYTRIANDAGVSVPPSEPNARAIAALRNVAPALLASHATLRGLLSALDFCGGGPQPDSCDCHYCGAIRALDALDAAIRAEMERQG